MRKYNKIRRIVGVRNGSQLPKLVNGASINPYCQGNQMATDLSSLAPSKDLPTELLKTPLESDGPIFTGNKFKVGIKTGIQGIKGNLQEAGKDLINKGLASFLLLAIFK